MIKQKLKGSGKNIIKNKSFLNNQNYVVNNKIKSNLLFDYYFVKNNNSVLLGLIGKIIKKVFIFLVEFFNNKHNKIKYYYIIHLLFGILLLPLLQNYIYIYVLILFFITFWISNSINDFYNTSIYILRIKNSIGNKYFRYSYISRLIEYIRFSDKVFRNNLYIILLSALATSLTTTIFYLILGSI